MVEKHTHQMVGLEMMWEVSSDTSRAWVSAGNTSLHPSYEPASEGWLLCVDSNWQGRRRDPASAGATVHCEWRTRSDQYEPHLFNSIVARQKRNDVAKLRLFPRFAFTGKTGKCNDMKPWDPSWHGRVNSRVKWESGRWYQQSITLSNSLALQLI